MPPSSLFTTHPAFLSAISQSEILKTYRDMTLQ